MVGAAAREGGQAEGKGGGGGASGEEMGGEVSGVGGVGTQTGKATRCEGHDISLKLRGESVAKASSGNGMAEFSNHSRYVLRLISATIV